MVRQWADRALEMVQYFYISLGAQNHLYEVEGAVWCKLFINLVCTLTLPI